MHRNETNVTHTSRFFLVAAGVALAACSDPFEPILTPVPEPFEDELVDFDAGGLVDPAAFDMILAAPVRTDLTTGWDFVFRVDPTLGPVLVPRNAFVDDDSSAGLLVETRAFDEVDSVPEDGYESEAPIPVAPGTVLAMISRQHPQFSVRCRRFGLLEVLSIEGDPARLTVRHVVNPNCERQLVKEEETTE